MRRAGPLRWTGSVCQDLGTSVKHTKNQLHDYMEKSQPSQLGSRHRDAGILARPAENLFHSDCKTSPAGQPNTFRH